MAPKAFQATMGPGPFLQSINRSLHVEPIASIAYFCVWSFVLVVICPLCAVFVLLPRLVFRLYSHGTGQLEDNYFDPSNHKDSKMAVVITGCDSGFGRELALYAAEAGFVVFAGCLKRDSFDQVTVAPRGTIHALELDVTQDKHVAKMAEEVNEWLKDDTGGKEKRVLHALVNNAGIGFSGNIDWAELSDFQKIFDVNFFGTVRCCRALLPIMKEQGIKATHSGTRILNVTSLAGIVPGGNMGALYCSSKHAAQCFTECLRKEIADFDIHVSSINPSLHGTHIVDRMASNMLETWNKLTPEKRGEYGEDYLTLWVERMNWFKENFTWKMDTVVDQMLLCLKSRIPPGQLLVGMDARFLMVLTRMLPGWLMEINEKNEQLIPAAMKKEK